MNSKSVNAKLKQINEQRLSVKIESASPMIQHKWSEKAKREMRDKQQLGKKTRSRDVRVPEDEFRQAMYITEDERHGIPAMALKSAIVSAAHKDIGIEKTLVRKALFIVCQDPGGVIPMECDEPVMREDMVRVGAGSADLRYRPQFNSWSVVVDLQIDADLLQIEDVLNLIDRAGFGIGIGEWRPEKGGDYGRFRVARE